MAYVPISIYPNGRSGRGCILFASVFLALAAVGFQFIDNLNMRLAVYCLSMAGFGIAMLNGIAVLRQQPMIKILDDRLSVYTPFGPAVVRFGEVLSFRKGRVPFLQTMRVDINNASRARFPSGFNKLLYSVTHMNFSNTIAIHGFMLGADLDALIQVLEKRRLAAVQSESEEVDDFVFKGLTSTG